MDLAKENEPKPKQKYIYIFVIHITYDHKIWISPYITTKNVFPLGSLSLDITRSPFLNHPESSSAERLRKLDALIARLRDSQELIRVLRGTHAIMKDPSKQFFE